jgi:long-chain acyl-CoA synthetase
MLDLQKYSCLGAALRDALDRFSSETCLIEADRDREKTRLTYSDFKEISLPLARALEDADFDAGDRAAIMMTNQSKWLISAYAIFYSGGVLVPLDYKLTAAEQLQLLEHSKAKVLVVEYHLWRAIMQSPEFHSIKHEAGAGDGSAVGRDLAGAFRWEDFKRKGAPDFVMRQRDDVACIVYSSGTGGRPKGCVLTHENYLEQCIALTAWYPFWPGVRYLSILPTNHAIDFMVGFIGPFRLRGLRGAFAHAASGICAGRVCAYRITYVALVPMILKNLERGLRAKFDELPSWKRMILNRMIGLNKLLTRRRPKIRLSRALLGQVHRGFGGELLALITGGAFMEPSTMQFFYDLGIPVVNGYGLTEAGTALTLNDLKPFRADTVGKPMPGVELRILNPDADGVGEVAARSKTIMSHYLDDAELTLETIVEGWLLTGDLGRFDRERTSATFRAQEEHDRYRGRKEYLSRRHRDGFRRPASKGILHCCCELCLAKEGVGAGDAGHHSAAGAEPALRQQATGGDGSPQPAFARFQTCGRIFGVEQGLSPYCFHEGEAPGTGRRYWQERGRKSDCDFLGE